MYIGMCVLYNIKLTTLTSFQPVVICVCVCVCVCVFWLYWNLNSSTLCLGGKALYHLRQVSSPNLLL
jgi:hypothetical protein